MGVGTTGVLPSFGHPIELLVLLKIGGPKDVNLFDRCSYLRIALPCIAVK